MMTSEELARLAVLAPRLVLRAKGSAPVITRRDWQLVVAAVEQVLATSGGGE
jgi:hypothetical protein